MTDDAGGNQHRRHDDAVTYREMVEFTSSAFEREHTVRAETLLLINASVEKIERVVTDHQIWHRDVLQGFLDRATSQRTAIISVVIAAVACLVSAVSAIAILTR